MKVEIKHKGQDSTIMTLGNVEVVQITNGMLYAKASGITGKYVGNYNLEDFDFEVSDD